MSTRRKFLAGSVSAVAGTPATSTSARSQTNVESSVSEIVSLCGEWFFRTDPEKWGEGDFPFLIVQLPNYGKKENQPTESDWAELREVQLMALRLPNTGFAVTIDLGEANDVHPHKKAEVGQRLALSALRTTHGKNIVHSGPLYESMQVEGNRIRIRFKHIGSGLAAREGELKGFAVAGTDPVFHWANAVVDDDTVVVSSSEVPAPVAVRYAWAANPDCNLYNKEGIPASPFRTDDWPGVTANER